jgi:hypothetical protein
VIRQASLALALSAVLVAPTVAQSQTVLGIRGGVNVATLDGDDVPVNPDSRVGLNIGGSVSVPLSGAVGVRLGASYSQRGAKLEGEDGELGVQLDYIEIPALLTLTFRSDGPVGGRFYLGPTVAVEVGCELSLENQGVKISADCDQPDDPLETETFDIGAMAGAGLLWGTAGGTELSVDVLYNLGLTSISEEDDVKHRMFTIQAGVGFPL